jgi:hypothetical protein
MEIVKLEAFKIVLFILPGIISLRIKAALSISSPSKPLNTAIDGLILTLVDHAVFGLAKAVAKRTLSPELLNVSKQFLVELGNSLPGEWAREFSSAGGFPIIGVAFAVGLVAGVTRYHGWDFSLLRRVKATNRTGENLVWAEALTKLPRESYAVVACKDGSRFLGVIDTFSEEAGNYEILLSRAAQVQADGSFLPIDGDGVLLTRENPIIRVEFWRSGVTNGAGQGGADIG